MHEHEFEFQEKHRTHDRQPRINIQTLHCLFCTRKLNRMIQHLILIK